ncbi:hypothetical protein KEJ18_01435 [Candidatus Bathyarchaeota archaeon]|nr:hypothetical protein [Candidatus Bathyarchaeota archaeon]
MKKWLVEDARKNGLSASNVAVEYVEPEDSSRVEVKNGLKNGFSSNSRLHNGLENIEKSQECFSADQLGSDNGFSATCSKHSLYSSKPYGRQKTLQIICGNEGAKLTHETLFELSRSKVRLIP